MQILHSCCSPTCKMNEIIRTLTSFLERENTTDRKKFKPGGIEPLVAQLVSATAKS